MRHKSNDPARLSRIERRVFVTSEVTPGSTVHYGSWSDREDGRCGRCGGIGEFRSHGMRAPIVRVCEACQGSGRVRVVPMTLIDAATSSDYSGSLVEISNALCLKEKFPWLVEIYGGHGTRGVAYLGKRENQNPELIEAVEGLADYPLFDEDHHSHLEWDRAAVAWEEDGRDDFQRELVKRFDAAEDLSHELSDENFRERVDALYDDLVEIFRGGERYLNEQGDSIYFPVYQIFKQVDDARFASHLDRGPYDGSRPSLRDQLDALRVASRVIDTDNTDTSNTDKE